MTILLEAYRTGAWGLWLDRWHQKMLDEYRIKPVRTTPESRRLAKPKMSNNRTMGDGQFPTTKGMSPRVMWPSIAKTCQRST